MADETKPDPGTPMPAQEIPFDPAIFKKLPVGAVPTSASGVAGTVPGTSGGYSNPQINEFIGQLLNTQEAQRTNALNQLGNLFTLRAAGFPINPNAFKKYVNQSHLKGLVPTDPAQLQDFFTAQQQQTQTQTPFARAEQQDPRAAGMFGMQPGALPRNPFQQNRDGTITAQPGLPEHVQEAVSLHNDLVTGKADPKTIGERSRSMHVKAIAHAAMQQIKTMGQAFAASTKADLEQQKLLGMVGQYENEILADPANPESARKLGVLQRLGLVPYNVDAAKWATLSPEEQHTAARIWAGYMSPADQAKMNADFAQNMVNTGQADSLSDAMRLAPKLLSGEQLTPEEQKLIHPSFVRAAQYLGMGNALLEVGLPPEKLSQAMNILNNGGSMNDVMALLPEGARPYALQRLQAELAKNQNEATLAGMKMQTEYLRARREYELADPANAKAKQAAADELKAFDDYRIASEVLSKNPNDPAAKAAFDGAKEQVMKYLPIEETDEPDFWNWLPWRQPTFHKVYKPRVGEGALTQAGVPAPSGTPAPGAPTAPGPPPVPGPTPSAATPSPPAEEYVNPALSPAERERIRKANEARAEAFRKFMEKQKASTTAIPTIR